MPGRRGASERSRERARTQARARDRESWRPQHSSKSYASRSNAVHSATTLPAHRWKFPASQFATSAPPWPSNTATNVSASAPPKNPGSICRREATLVGHATQSGRERSPFQHCPEIEDVPREHPPLSAGGRLRLPPRNHGARVCRPAGRCRQREPSLSACSSSPGPPMRGPCARLCPLGLQLLAHGRRDGEGTAINRWLTYSIDARGAASAIGVFFKN